MASNNSPANQTVLKRYHRRYPTRSAKRAKGLGTDWANLPSQLVELIAERVLANDVDDYIRFRTACSTWRRCTEEPSAHGPWDHRFYPRRWIMLPEPTATPLHRFLNVSTGECIHVHLPELDDHDVFGHTTDGLLVLQHYEHIRLFNPLTRLLTELPPLSTLLSTCGCTGDEEDVLLRIKYSNPIGASLANDSTVALDFRASRKLAVAKPGDQCWTLVNGGEWLQPTLSFSGRLYCLTSTDVMVVETKSDQPPRLVVAAELARRVHWLKERVHLVDNGGEMLVVYRTSDDQHWKFSVYRVDLDARMVVPVSSLGGRALFIGCHRTLSFCTKVFPALSADTIYFGFD